jgi:hypothetical protein
MLLKSKNTILTLMAIVFAATSAFTGKDVDLSNNVSVKWKQTPGGNFVCTTIPRKCSNAYSLTCQVAIVKSNFSHKTVIAYDDDDCVVALTHESPFPIPAYDAGSDNRPYDVE